MLGIFFCVVFSSSLWVLVFTPSVFLFPEHASCLHLRHSYGSLVFSGSIQHPFHFFSLLFKSSPDSHVLVVRLWCCCDQIFKVNREWRFIWFTVSESSIHIVYGSCAHSEMECLGNGSNKWQGTLILCTRSKEDSTEGLWYGIAQGRAPGDLFPPL